MEKALREQNAGPQLWAARRAWQSRPVLARLRRALEVVRRRVRPKSLLGQAIDYTLARWAALTRYVEYGHLELDNNLCYDARVNKGYAASRLMPRGSLKPDFSTPMCKV